MIISVRQEFGVSKTVQAQERKSGSTVEAYTDKAWAMLGQHLRAGLWRAIATAEEKAPFQVVKTDLDILAIDADIYRQSLIIMGRETFIETLKAVGRMQEACAGIVEGLQGIVPLSTGEKVEDFNAAYEKFLELTKEPDYDYSKGVPK